MIRAFLGWAVALTCLLLLVACGSDSESGTTSENAPAWNHNPDDASLGPSNWGDIDDSFELCLTGTGQSPIDIAATVEADLAPLELNYTATPPVVENTGHVIEVPMPENSNQTLSIEDRQYRLVQYHFHAPSEHTLDGASYDVEAHLVHQDDRGELAVVAVFFDDDYPPNPLVESVLSNAPEEAGQEVELEESWSPLALLSDEGSEAVLHRYYTYTGSLTTPACSEGVRWIVLKDTFGVSPEATDRLHELIADFPGYDGYGNNNRPTQPRNDREVESSAD